MKKWFSRKLFVALGAAISAAATGHWQEAAIVVVGYLLGQGIADAKAPATK
jgi:hypothetical protein